MKRKYEHKNRNKHISFISNSPEAAIRGFGRENSEKCRLRELLSFHVIGELLFF